MDNTLMEQRSQFAEILGLEGPVPEEVLKLAVENESYARNLLLSKDHPEILEVLLKKPRSQNIQEFSNTDLIKKAATAILRWSQTGFSVVNVQVLERREDACLQCSNLRDPKGMLQQLIPSAGLNNKPGHRTGKKVCDLCGCNVSNKIRLPSEACPGIHPDNHELTLWGEPIKHRNK
ncbi:hypothetical protein [Chitinophaga sancti]|uniref:Uncharacterized protein n=1 Tax=Chitinophaga sancti TaxID=1004 RepID=A0A1K1RT95_9BACT|nr:hypothetical protein [Chitinophaga sancti]WQD62448.1 hypothetical protein U0033_31645 [Chitinophaga sancti]WQG91983.1 hypothetical protein SR876_10740 [Chitinophaga sancti]SFW75053.1 hypothetical protein SAMN05661012_04184 [Chitinophaga sancti]